MEFRPLKLETVSGVEEKSSSGKKLESLKKSNFFPPCQFIWDDTFVLSFLISILKETTWKSSILEL